MIQPSFDEFCRLAREGNIIPLRVRMMGDQLTPVLAYRRLVAEDDRTAPSFLFESVEGAGQVGRYSILGAQPAIEVLAREHEVTLLDHRDGSRQTMHEADPLAVLKRLTHHWRLPSAEHWRHADWPRSFLGGWVGQAGYDTVRYLEPDKLPFSSAPRDDRHLSDLHFGLYRETVVFDHVDKIVHAICHVQTEEHASFEEAYEAGCRALRSLTERLDTHRVPLRSGEIDLNLMSPTQLTESNVSRQAFERAVSRAREYIAAGDIFQVVLSQRFERRTNADPFDIYRALRVVNPSPYMVYLQMSGAILVASSPEILCRVRSGTVTNRPLAGTRRRGRTEAEDQQLEAELLSNEKERAEHIMLVDLGRNDLGRVCEVRSIQLERTMEIERYSHVMHISSTVTGRLRESLDAWDALRATLPVGTVSGAPKIRAMQIIDELESTRRGPYGGGMGGIGFDGDMDIALTLRTMVIPIGDRRAGEPWVIHLQAGAGIVADSDPAAEYTETVNKAAALGRAIDLAERAFGIS